MTFGAAMSKVEKTNSRFSMLSRRLLSLWQTRRLLRRSILSLISLFVAVGLFGFLAAPSLLRGALENALSDALHRPVSVGAVSVNPYALSLAVEKLSVKDKGGKDAGELFGVDRLYVNLESVSLWHGGPVLRELAVEGPRLALTRAKDGRYNVSDLIDEWMAKPASPGAVFSLNNIHVSHGHFSFADALSGSHHEVTELALSLPFLSSLPYQTDIFVEPAFTATIDGAAFALKGKSKPFSATHESELGFDLDGFDLMRIAGYLPTTLPVRLASGKVDGDIHLSFKAADKGVSTLLLNGRLALHQLAVQTAKGQPLLTAKKIGSEIVDLDVFGRRVQLKHLLIDQPDIRLSRDADGAWLGMPAESAQGDSKNSGKGSKAEGKRAPEVRKGTSPGWRL